MLSDDDLRRLLRHGEADHVERTVSLSDRREFGEAVCASGIPRATAALRTNGNQPAKFRTELDFVNVTIWALA